MRDGTFSISNHGVSGSLLAAPIIINQPQSAILGVGKLEKRAVVRDDQIVIRQMCYVTLTIDHRVIRRVPDQCLARAVRGDAGELACRLTQREIEPRETAEADAAAAVRAPERVIRKPRQELRERHTRLHPRQVHPRALMHTGGEGEMTVGIARDIERFRLSEGVRVAVGGADAQGHERSGRECDAADLRLRDVTRLPSWLELS